MPTNAVILANAPIACVLAGNDIAKGSIFGARINPQLDQKIYSTYFVIKKIYDHDPFYSGMDVACLYLWELMSMYGIKAMSYTGGGGSVAPVTPTSGGYPYIFEVQSAQFANATDYVNTDIYVLQIEFNDAPTVLQYGIDWVRLDGGGFRVLLPGFDATVNNYTFYVFINATTGTTPIVPPSGTVVQVHTSGTTVTVANPTTWLIVNPATLLATLTATLQAAPYDGQLLKMSFGGTISGGSTVVTAITINANTGYSILEDTTPTIVRAGDEISYKLYGTIWYRIN